MKRCMYDDASDEIEMLIGDELICAFFDMSAELRVKASHHASVVYHQYFGVLPNNPDDGRAICDALISCLEDENALNACNDLYRRFQDVSIDALQWDRIDEETRLNALMHPQDSEDFRSFIRDSDRDLLVIAYMDKRKDEAWRTKWTRALKRIK